MTMRASHLAGVEIESLVDPSSKVWRGRPGEKLTLMGTPAGMQPTAAIRVAWTNKRIGAVSSVHVDAIHNGEVLAFRLEWEDPSENSELSDNEDFPDAAAIALPAAPGAPLILMGAEGLPVNAWYWRADEKNAARHVSAQGLGTSQTLDTDLVKARGVWRDGRWQVVIARPMQVSGVTGCAQLEPGQETGFGVAIWEGSNRERAGIKAFSGDWKPLILEGRS
jgi:DMSO reductase family type II enzyme heme b subunit